MVDEKSIIVNLTQLDFYPIENELTESQIKSRWKELCKVYHPDATNFSTFQDGGKQAKVNAAKDFLLQNLETINYYIRKTNHKLNEEDLRREREAAQQREQEAAAKRAAEEAERKRKEEEAKRRAEAERRRKEEEERRRQQAAGAQTQSTYGSSSRSSSTYSSRPSSSYNSSSSSSSYSSSSSSRSYSSGGKMKKSVKVVIIIFAVMMLLSVIVAITQMCSSRNSGSNAKHKIGDRQSLLAITENPEASYTLTADIDLSDEDWTPIEAFSGKLNGNGFTISGLKVSSIKTDYVGLFQTLNKNAVIENIVLTDLDISTSNTAKGIGGIAGISYGTIKNCKVSGTISLSGCDNVGGIVGIACDSTKAIEGCTFNGTVEGGSNIGGIVGTDKDSGITVTGCDVSGKVTGFSGVGGILGICSSSNGRPYTLENNTNKADVTGAGEYVGGIVGRLYAGSNWGAGTIAISGSSNSGKVTGKNNTAGIAGFLGCAMYSSATLTSCTNTGAISGETYVGGILGYSNDDFELTGLKSSGGVKGYSYVGGFVGSATSATITGAKNTDAVTGTASVGGIAGEIEKCLDCENTAKIEATGSIDNYTVLGGISGRVSVAKNCINRGEIVASTVGNGVGGISGLHQTERLVEITNCENYGAIKLINATSAGGIIGDITYSGLRSAAKVHISGCTNYADITVTGSGKYVAGIIGRYQDVAVMSDGPFEINSCRSSGNITADGCEYVAGILGYSKGGTGTLVTLTVSGKIRGNDNVAKIAAMISSCPNISNYSSSFNTSDCVAESMTGNSVPIYVLSN